jgi:outer membrane protein OmpA-like peptidoglycan-associated protein
VEPGLLQTGVIDEATRRAIGIFQMQNQLPSTGHLNGETVAALQSACQARGTETGSFETEWETPPGTSPAVATVQIQDNLPAIFFKRDSIEIRQDAGADSVVHLLHLLMQIRSYTGHITLHGFASAEGNPARNSILSQKRADRVKQLLVEAGFDADKITAIGHGVGNIFPVRELNRAVAIERK